MAIDLRQFHQTFFEESLEGVSEMESELLKIEAGMSGQRVGDPFEADREALNTIFRAAHSIKGGAATFGFTAISDFAHVAETLLDDVREGRVTKNRSVLTVLLQSADCLRNLLVAARDGSGLDTAHIEAVRHELESVRESGAGPAGSTAGGRAARQQHISERGWRIDFRPHPNLFLTGNDPLRILRELATLGHVRANVSTTALPSWSSFDPSLCYLAWNIEVEGRIAREAISEAFAWVEGDCDLNIAPLAAPESRKVAAESNAAAQQSIRVSLPRIDALVDLVGELVITQTMLSRFQNGELGKHGLDKLQEGLAQLERNTRDLQESVMRIRMLPIGFAFNRLPRIVRDLSHQLDKKVELRILGEQTELDKTVIERISDPLMHLVRNCLDHGIEHPAERRAAGKSETATVRVEAFQRNGNVVIEIEDDGRGLPRDKILAKAVARGIVAPDTVLSPEQIDALIFMPGFSTAEVVTDVSGRGVGLDVVRSNLESVGGSVEVLSHGNRGTRFTLRLPLTLAMMEGLIVKASGQTYIVPLLSVIESLSVSAGQISRPAGGSELVRYQDDYIPLLRLGVVFGAAPAAAGSENGIVVVVDVGGKRVGLFVDDLVGQQQVVVKSLETHYRKIDGIATATILGDGEVVLVLDLTSLSRIALERAQAA